MNQRSVWEWLLAICEGTEPVISIEPRQPIDHITVDGLVWTEEFMPPG